MQITFRDANKKVSPIQKTISLIGIILISIGILTIFTLSYKEYFDNISKISKIPIISEILKILSKFSFFTYSSPTTYLTNEYLQTMFGGSPEKITQMLLFQYVPILTIILWVIIITYAYTLIEKGYKFKYTEFIEVIAEGCVILSVIIIGVYSNSDIKEYLKFDSNSFELFFTLSTVIFFPTKFINILNPK